MTSNLNETLNILYHYNTTETIYRGAKFRSKMAYSTAHCHLKRCIQRRTLVTGTRLTAHTLTARRFLYTDALLYPNMSYGSINLYRK